MTAMKGKPKSCEVGFGNRRAARRGFDDRGALGNQAVAESVEEQGAGEAVLEAPRRMGGFILQVEVNLLGRGQVHPDEVGVRRALEIRFNRGDRLVDPISHPSHFVPKIRSPASPSPGRM